MHFFLLLSLCLLVSSELEVELADQGMDELDPVFFIKLAPDAKRPKVKRPLSQLPLLHDPS